MSRYSVRAVLWRQVLDATIKTLTDQSKGQYHIALTSDSEIEKFFAGLTRENSTAQGGYDIQVRLEALGGQATVAAQSLRVRYMGASSERQDWNIPSQRSTTAYPLWRPGRAFDASNPPQIGTEAIVIVRDAQCQFHARWLTHTDIARLPTQLRERIAKNGAGVWWAGKNSMSENSDALRVFDALQRHYNVLLYGPPATGKTHLLQEIEALFRQDSLEIDTEQEHGALQGGDSKQTRVGFVTFHQSLGYEDFVVGLRPDLGSSKLLALEAVPGILLELAEHARRPGCRALLLIDEINRGNASRIFGELITLLDADKRLNDAGTASPTTVHVRLPHQSPGHTIQVMLDGSKVPVPEPFTMPRRFYIVATMNSVDRSVAPLDAALRRRFHVERLGPDLRVLAQKLGVDVPASTFTLPSTLTDVKDVSRLAIALLRALNEGIGWFLGPDFQLGHWYLSPLVGVTKHDDAEARLIEIWEHRLLPQLEEYFQGRTDQLRVVLRAPPADSPVGWRDPPRDFDELGATPTLLRRASGIAGTLRLLRHIASVRDASGTSGAGP